MKEGSGVSRPGCVHDTTQIERAVVEHRGVIQQLPSGGYNMEVATRNVRAAAPAQRAGLVAT